MAVQHVVQMPVVEGAVDVVLQRLQLVVVALKTVCIQLLRSQFHHHNVVVPVQPVALVMLV